MIGRAYSKKRKTGFMGLKLINSGTGAGVILTLALAIKSAVELFGICWRRLSTVVTSDQSPIINTSSG